MHVPRKEKWQGKLKRSRYLVGAIVFHLILFLMLATLVIWPVTPQPPTAVFQKVNIQLPPPPPPPPPTDQAASNPDAAPNPVPVDAVPPPSVIVSTNPIFTLDSPKISEKILENLSNAMPQGSGPGGPGGFGSLNGSDGQLKGYLYDLKQTRNKAPTGMTPETYHQIISQFVAANWDHSILEQYYKAAHPLFTPFIFIPTIHAEDGPKAFHVEGEVQPNMYVVWYKITATPLKDGTYHFVGLGDDIMVVRENGQTVLDGCLTEVDDAVRQREKSIGGLYVGTPFHAKAGEPVDIDVLIGEEPGGTSSYFLLLQREETIYQNQSNGTPLLPIFQLGSDPIHVKSDPSFGPPPPYSQDVEPWQAMPSQ